MKGNDDVQTISTECVTVIKISDSLSISVLVFEGAIGKLQRIFPSSVIAEISSGKQLGMIIILSA
jgi:hypothetical protein